MKNEKFTPKHDEPRVTWIAKPALEAEAQRRNRLVGQAANPAQNIEDDIDKRRRELKLAEARRRCGF